MTKFELPFMGNKEDQIAKIQKWQEMSAKLPPNRRAEFFDMVYSNLEDLQTFDWSVYRACVFAYQYLQQNNVLSKEQMIKAYKQLINLCGTNIVAKKFAFSNAVSITLREFFNDSCFPKSEIEKGYQSLVTHMEPISKGFGSDRCQRCWHKTFKDMLIACGQEIGKEEQIQIYNITQLNIFQNQLADSYDSDINELMNNFYKRFFSNVKDIRVHDIKTDDKKTKQEDRDKQKQGVDKSVTLKDGTTLLVEEKMREPRYWENRKTDILLEYISMDSTNTPGWVYTSKSHYLVILFKNIDIKKSEVYVFPFPAIRKWVKQHQTQFMSYQTLSAHNVTWHTLSKAVPLNVVINDILKDEDPKYKKLHKII